MSPASHMVGRLRELYGIVLNRMHRLDERRWRCCRDSSALMSRSIIEPLEPRVLLSGLPAGELVDDSLQSNALSPAQLDGGLRFNFVLYDISQGAPYAWPRPSEVSPTDLSPLSSASPVGLTSSQIRAAYGIDSIIGDGTGQTIAIVDAYDDPALVNSGDPGYATSDLYYFNLAMGLPQFGGAGPTFRKVGQDGSSTLAPPSGTSGWSVEEALDVEWAHAIAPGANIILVEGNSTTDADLVYDVTHGVVSAVDTARHLPGVSVVSMSFGRNEDATEVSLDTVFTTPAGHAGVTFVASTGDDGAPGGFPAYSPNVVAVGGTTLTLSGGNYGGETGWSGSGGGQSSYESEPGYQTGVQASGWRQIPDVAFDADPASGVAVYDSYDYGSSLPWVQVGGTSLSAPCWAGLIAIADQLRASAGSSSLDGLTQTLPALYGLPAADFHDITSGNNGHPAGPGYDMVTGIGTPVTNLLVPHLAFGLSMAVVSSTPASGSVVTTRPADFVINFSDPYLSSSIDAGDLTVNGVAADTFTPTDLDTVTFHYSTSPVTTQGLQNMSIAAGAVLRASDHGANVAWNTSFRYDVHIMTVVSTSPPDGSVVTLPFGHLDLHFDEAVDPGSIWTNDLTLSQGTVSAATAVDAHTARYTLTGINTEGTLTVNLAAGAVADTWGNPGAVYSGSFTLDIGTVAYPVPLTGVAPLGSLIYDPIANGTISPGGDTDSFTISLDAGQTLTVVVDPAASLQPTIEVRGPGGAVLGTASAALAGKDAVLQTVPVATAGTYTITVGSLAGTTGQYTVQAVLNAALEAESHDGPGNATRPTAQNLDPSFISLGGAASRGAVLGTSDMAAGLLPAEVEPNNSIGQANAAAGNFTAYSGNLYHIGIKGSISTSTDADWFKLGSMGVGDVITVSESGTPSSRGTLGDTYVYLYRYNGGSPISVASDDDSGPGYESLIYRYSVSVADTYYAVADAYSSNTGTYDLGVWLENSGAVPLTGGTLTSETEPNDTYSTANDASTSWRAVQYLSQTSGTLTSGDLDYYSFQFTAGDLVSTNIAAGSGLYARSWLLNSSGTAIALEDGSSSGPSPNSPIYAYQIPTTGTYYLEVAAYSGTGSYSANVYLSTNTPPPVPSSGADYYSFSLNAGDVATLGLTGLSAGTIHLSVEDASGTTLTIGATGSSNLTEVISNFFAVSSGIYYARVTGVQAAPYSLTIARNLSLDTEPNDSSLTATDLLGSRSALGSVGVSDSFLYVINWQDGRIFQVDPSTGAILNTLPAPSTFIATNPFGLNLAAAPNILEYNAGQSFGDTRVAQLNMNTGAMQGSWVGAGSPSYYSVAYLNGEIYACDDTGIRVMDAATGALHRSLSLPGGVLMEGMAGDIATGHLFANAQATHMLYEIDPLTGAVLRSAPNAYVGYEQDLGLAGNEIFVTETTGTTGSNWIRVYDKATFALQRTLTVNVPSGSMVAGVAAVHDADTQDWYQFSVNAGDALTISTATPGDGPNEFVNTLDPKIELYDPSGTLVAFDDNSAVDGRNALLSYTALATGMYRVRVLAAASSGEYVLNVAGATGALPGFAVAAIDLPDGARLRTVPSTITVDFNDAVLPSSLQASDLRVDLVAATGVTMVDSDTWSFTLPGGLGEGIHTVTIAAGAILDLQGTPVSAFTSHFSLDLTPPRVISSSIQQNDVLPAGSLTYSVQFSEPMNVSNLDPTDVTLHGQYLNVNYTPSHLAYDPTGTILAASYTGLPEDAYTLTLLSADTRFEDVVGWNLDGEALAWPIPPNTSGDGTEGGNFAVGFYLSGGPVAFPVPLTATQPLGSLVYGNSVASQIEYGADTDPYTLALDAGQTLTVLVDPAAGLRPTIEVRGPSGTVLGSGTAAAAGKDVFLQTLPVAVAGTYTITVASAGATSGTYTLTATLNAAQEAESHDGAGNDTRATAQNIDGTFVSLGGTAARGAVLGTEDIALTPLPNEIEPNNTTATANSAVVNFVSFSGSLYHLGISGTIGSVTDSDWFQLGAFQAGDTLSITQSGSPGSRGTLANPYVELYRGSPASPILVASNDDGGPGADSLVFRYAVTATDTYYVRAGSYSIANLGTYQLGLWLENVGPAPLTGGTLTGETEYNDAAILANDASTSWRAVQYRSSTAGTITSGDLDYYSFQFTAGDLVSVNIGSTSALDTRVWLLNSGGTVIASEDGTSSGPSLNSPIYAYRIPATGTYYVEVGAYSGTGSYNADVYLSTTTPPPAPSLGGDYYSLNLASGDVVTLGLTGLTAGTIHLGLENATGTPLAIGVAGATNLTEAISNFAIPATGVYYARINGLSTAPYSLVITRNAGFDTEPNNTIPQAMPLPIAGVSGEQTVLGYIEAGTTGVEPDNYPVGTALTNVVPGITLTVQGGTNAVTSQTSSYHSTGTRVFANGTDTGWWSSSYWLRADFATPVSSVSIDLIPDDTYDPGIMRAYNASGTLLQELLVPAPPLGGFTTMTITRPSADIAYIMAAGNDGEVAMLDNLVVNGGGSGNDYYSVSASAGDVLTMRTRTPADGPNEFVNALDPKIELYDPAGTLVASDDNSAPDGRNALLTYTALASGTYTIRVLSNGGTTGEYVLTKTAEPLGAPTLDPEPAYTPGTSNTIQWSAVPNADHYYAEYDDDPAFGSPDGNSGWITQTSYTFTSLPNNVTLYYRVKAGRTIPGTGGSWTQTSQADFQTDTLNNISASLSPGDVTLAQTGTIFFQDGFEDGDYNGWVPGSGSYTRQVTNLTAAVGTYSFTQIGGSSNHYDGVSHPLAGITPDQIDFYVRTASNTSISGYFVVGTAPATSSTAVFFGMKNDGRMGIYDETSWHDTPYVANQWYHVKFVMNWTARTVDYYVDGALISANVSFRAPSVSSLTNVYLYNVYNTQAWWDEITFRNGTGGSGYVPSGNIVATAISRAPSSQWGTLMFDKTTPTHTTLTVDVLDASGALLAAGVASGTNLNALGIAQLSIKLRGNMATTDAAVTPSLQDWTVAWDAVPTYAGSAWSNVVSSTQQLATEEQWTGGVSGQWNNPANWALGFVPGTDTVAVFDGPVTRQPVLGQNQTVKGIDIRSADWTINVNGHTLILGSGGLSLPGGASPTAKIDLADGNLIIDYTGASPLSSVRDWVKAGANYDPGSGEMLWNGKGITSSTAAAGDHMLVGLGVRNAVDAGSFAMPTMTALEGVAVDSTATLVKYTYMGDVNLDGVVNQDDYDVMDYYQVFGTGGEAAGAGWWTGDLNGNGVIDQDDYDLADYGQVFQSGVLGQAQGIIVAPESPPTAASAIVDLLLASGGAQVLAAELPFAARADPAAAVSCEAAPVPMAVRPLKAASLAAATDGALRLSGGAEPEPIQLII